MAEIGNVFEFGDFFAEFDGHYLGRGKTLISLSPVMRDIRQDEFSVPVCRQVRAVRWQITLQLLSPEKCWELLAGNGGLDMAQFTDGAFRNGAVLNLYASDQSRQGFSFGKAFLENLQHCSGENLEQGSLKLHFVCEADSDKQYLSRTPAGELPGDAGEFTGWDIESLAAELQERLGFLLDAVPDQAVRMNTVWHDQRCGWILSLCSCRNWQYNMPRISEWKLTAQFPLDRKNEYDSKLFNAAVKLHGSTLNNLPPGNRLRVDQLDLDQVKSVGGTAMNCAVMKFSLLSN